MAFYELRRYDNGERIWIGEYRNLRNLPHWHCDCELIYVESGTTVVYVCGERYELGENQTVFVDESEIHSIEASEESVLLLFLFAPELLREIAADVKPENPLLKNRYDVKKYAHAAELELDNKAPFYTVKTENILREMMIEIMRNEKLMERRPESGTYYARYKELLDDIEVRYQYYTFSDAAAFMSMSEHYFSGFFHKMSGLTFSKYLNIVKVRNAVEMLLSPNGGSITEIACKCGFNTIRHFNRIFKSVTGFAPSELPRGYRLNIHSMRDKKTIDPTLEGSKLLTKTENKE